MVSEATKLRAKGLFTTTMRRIFPFTPTTPKGTKELIMAQWAGLADAIIAAAVELIGTGGTGGGSVNSVNNQTPDENGNVTLTAANVGALATGGTAADSSKLGGSAASAYEKTANKGAASGYCGLDANGLIATNLAAAVSGVTPDAASDDETLATTEFVNARIAAAGGSGDVVFTPASDIANVIAALADTTTPLIKFTAGDYAFNDNNAVWGGSSTYGKKLITRGLVRFLFNNGYGLKTWTANDLANRAYDITGSGETSIKWDTANTRFEKTGGGNFPTFDTTWRLAAHGGCWKPNAATSGTTYIGVAAPENLPANPYISTTYYSLAQSSGFYKNFYALCIPTFYLALDGHLQLIGNAGHVGSLFDCYGLFDSDLSRGTIEMLRTDTSGAYTRTFNIGHTFNSKIHVKIKDCTHTSNYGIWWGYTFGAIDTEIWFDCKNINWITASHIGGYNEHVGMVLQYNDYLHVHCKCQGATTTVPSGAPSSSYQTITRLVGANPNGRVIIDGWCTDVIRNNGAASSNAFGYASANMQSELKGNLLSVP